MKPRPYGKLRFEILEAIESGTGNPSAIATRIGSTRTNVMKTIQRLLVEAKVVRVAKGVYGLPSEPLEGRAAE